MIHHRSGFVSWCAGVMLAASAGSAAAEGPWASLIPFKRVEANASKNYELSEEQGPWLILAANFAGPQAEQQARELVLELRSRCKLPAYVHRQEYDFTQPTQGTKITPRGDLATMRYANAQRYDGIAVLVGNFRSVEDSELDKTLDRIKRLEPECLTRNATPASNEPLASLKALKRRISSKSSQKRGPLGAAFATRNPLLPDEYFAPGGVDEFVARINRGVQYSLLDNPGRYTVRVATFRGNTSINQREIQEIESRDKLTNKLEIGADKAHRLTLALRDQGIDAYEFHDRMESIVTVGSFESEGRQLENGSVELNPAIYKVIEQYKAVERPVPGKGVVGLQPRVIGDISFDVQPTPIPVPKRSVAADYAPRRFGF